MTLAYSMNSSLLYFNGKHIDSACGYYHFRQGYRAFNPVLMRFSVPDSLSPFGRGGIHSYIWCQDDPVNRSDPSGHISWQVGIGILLSSIGLITTGLSAGVCLAITEGVGAALSLTPIAAQITTALAVTSDVTGIMGLVTAKKQPQFSTALSWIAFGTGMAALGMSLVPGFLQTIYMLREDTLTLQKRMALLSENGMGGKGSKMAAKKMLPDEHLRPVQTLPEDNPGGDSYLYRGIRHGHPHEKDALRGMVIPADPSSNITPYEHNTGRVSNSPYTSWTRDVSYARQIAGDDGLILRVKTGAPGPGEKWSWVMSDDRYWENEILLKGIRTSGVEVYRP